jgi:hypothetical protein
MRGAGEVIVQPALAVNVVGPKDAQLGERAHLDLNRTFDILEEREEGCGRHTSRLSSHGSVAPGRSHARAHPYAAFHLDVSSEVAGAVIRARTEAKGGKARRTFHGRPQANLSPDILEKSSIRHPEQRLKRLRSPQGLHECVEAE